MANRKNVIPLSESLQNMRDFFESEINALRSERATVMSQKAILRKQLSPLVEKEKARFDFEDALEEEVKLLAELQLQSRQLDSKQKSLDGQISGLVTLLNRFDLKLYKVIIKKYVGLVKKDKNVELAIGERKFLLRESIIAMRDELIAMGKKINKWEW